MDTQSYYAAQSVFTDLGSVDELLANMPKTVPELCEIVQGLCLPFEEIYKYPIQNERELDTTMRYADAILTRISKIVKGLPLTEERGEADRFVASTSDYANLVVALARQQGISARKRVGFVLFGTDYRIHDVVEYWDKAAWQWIDPSGLAKAEDFLPAAKAWQEYQAGNLSADRFRNEEHRGFPLLVSALLLDMAALLKMELLNWDRYSWMRRPANEFSARALEILDEAAKTVASEDVEALTALYRREEGLQVPEVVWSESPLVPPHRVELRR